MSTPRYQQLEQALSEEIRLGQRAPGERLPSIRQLSRERKLSKSTVLTAYSRLEADGLIEARPRSGYFVCAGEEPSPGGLKTPAPSKPRQKPAPVSAGQVLLDIMEQGAAFDLLPSVAPHSGNEQLRRCLARAQRRQSCAEQDYYDGPQGLAELRGQLAQRTRSGGSQVTADDLVVTAGCQHALLLALMATTSPGDVVAVESPGFYGVFQLLEALGLQALEMPSSAQTGISPDALELALQHWPVKALVVSPCYGTPTGACIPETHKRRLLELAQRHKLAVIEDDIYGELFFGLRRPRTLHSYDDSGSVLLCSSFSKSLSRDLRLGWIAPGKYLDRIKRLKVVTSLASSRTQQLGASYYLAEGGLERRLRQQRQRFRQQCQQLLTQIPVALPMALSCSRPEGGLSVWLELPADVDTIALYGAARAQGILVTPGPLFSAQKRYQSFLRLSFAHPWTPERRRALRQLGKLIVVQC